MDVFFIYLLKSGVCFTLFYLFVVTFLSRETFLRFNRYVLLMGMVGCLILPLVEINTTRVSVVQSPFIELENRIKPNAVPQISDIENIAPTPIGEITSTEAADKANIDPLIALLILYLLGGFVNVFILIRSVRAMFRLIKRGEQVPYKDYIFVISKEDISPFSWQKYIVISQNDYNENRHEIITHELAHIQHRHSLDIIFVEAILLIQWFNPAMWLLKREIQNIHEYQADMSVLESGIDATKYQLLLVKKAVGTSSYTLANSFNHSKIKKRITMMLKEKSSKWAKFRLVLLLPVITLSVYAFSRPEANVASNDKVSQNPQTEDIAEVKVPENDITGTWYLVASGVDKLEEVRSSVRIKTIKNGKFEWRAEANGNVIAGAKGTYTYDGKVYTETINTNLRQMAAYVGKKAVYNVSFKDGEMIIEGLLDGKIAVKEVWTRKVRFTPPVIKRDEVKPVSKTELIGTWKLLGEGVNRVKYINETEFTWVQFGDSEDSVVAGASGTYTLIGNAYTEDINKDIAKMSAFVGKKAVYTIYIEGNTMTIDGVLDGKYRNREVWTKVSSEVSAPQLK